MLLETEGKVIFVTYWHKAWLNCVFCIVWTTELVSNELGYLAEQISKKSVENAGWFFFAVYNKMQVER
jgi:hypothetical protein